MQFEFATATSIIFGAGTFSKIGQLTAEFGRRACIVSGLSGQTNQSLGETFNKSSVATIIYPIIGEPTIETIQNGVKEAKQYEAEVVIGLGGGSALDSAKAIAAMLTNPGELTNYVEVVGQDRSLTTPPVPIIAIPTTAGTGSEVTRNAVIGVPESAIKVSLRSPLMLPCLALIDPELTYNLPRELTASTGLDALTQLIEPFVCNNPNPITDGMCREGMNRSARMLLRAYRNGQDTDARQELCIASLLGGLALANARLGAVHGLAGALGGMLPIPHGAICARLLPLVMEINLRALEARLPDSTYIARYREVARIITGDSRANAIDGVQWVREQCATLHVQPLGNLGLRRSHFSDLIDKAFHASSMKGKPIPLMPDEVLEILERAL